MAPLDRQLRLLRTFALLNYPFACVPFLFLFFRQHGLDAQQYGLVISAYYLAMFVCEVPTGMLADRFGAKHMLVVGPALLAAGFGTLLAAPTFAGFLCGEILLGMGHAALSGPPATLLFETLRAHGKQVDYLRHEAKNSALRLFGTGSAFLLGGLLARAANDGGDAYGATILLTCGLTLAAAAVGSRIEPPPHRPSPGRRAFYGQLAAALSLPALRWLLLYWIVLFTLLRFPFHDYQPYLDAASVQEPLLADPLLVGVLFAALNLVAAPLSAALPWLLGKVGRVALFWLMPIGLSVSLLVMAGERQLAADGEGARWLPWLGVAMFFVQQVPFGLHWALLYDFVNHRLASETRTTVLSVLSLATRLCYAGCNVLLFGWQEQHGMAVALAIAGFGGLCATALVMSLRPRDLG